MAKREKRSSYKAALLYCEADSLSGNFLRTPDNTTLITTFKFHDINYLILVGDCGNGTSATQAKLTERDETSKSYVRSP